MKKILEIEACENCTHMVGNGDYEILECELKDFKMIEDEYSIPSWCPLPDAGWQDIATAPKDGTEVLVLLDVADTEIVHIAWFRGHEEWEQSGKYCGSFDSEDEWTGWWSYTRTSVTQEKLDGFRQPKYWTPYNPHADR